MKNPKHKKIRGFTFIEILTVIIVLSIVVGIGLPAYFWVRSDTRERKKEVAIQRVMEAKLKYYNSVKTAAALVPTPSPADIAPFLLINPTAGSSGLTATTNAFYSDNAECIFDKCFPSNERWYLNPNSRSSMPFFQKL